MPKLRELANAIRSKNAGPYVLSVDIMFKNEASYRKAVTAGVINPKTISSMYGVSPDKVQVVEYGAALAIKFTIPRPYPSGNFQDTDVLGAQQHAPLLDLEIRKVTGVIK